MRKEFVVFAMVGEKGRHNMNLLGTFYFPKKFVIYIYKHLILSKNSTTIHHTLNYTVHKPLN